MNNPTPTEQLTPEMGRAEIGALMGRLREQFGLSQQEVSERLHIRTRYVVAIEEGKFELMPGKVYARGYIHTYAEFLGLDADQVLTQCFPGEAVPSNMATEAPPVKRTPPPSSNAIGNTNWRGYGIMAAVGLVVILVISQFFGRGTPEPEKQEAVATSVAPVPEAMLQSMRTLMMPTAMNYPCLMVDSQLGCFYSGRAAQVLAQVNSSKGMLYLEGFDVSDLMLPELVAAAPAEQKVEEKAPEPVTPEQAKPEPAKEVKKPDEKKEAKKKPEPAKVEPAPVKVEPKPEQPKPAPKPEPKPVEPAEPDPNAMPPEPKKQGDLEKLLDVF